MQVGRYLMNETKSLCFDDVEILQGLPRRVLSLPRVKPT